MAKKSTSKRASSKGTNGTVNGTAANAKGKRLVIVESPAKARTINKYLGTEYVVRASVGHVRDLPSKSKKGEKSPVPGVDLEHDFAPTYEVLPGKNKTVTELKRAAKDASEVWFATDLDREGEAIAWHLAQILGIDPERARRVVFNAITKEEIQRAFSNPHQIDMNKVDAQQARRILDRIVGYQVSPLLWKKVARGLSAGRVQSVAVRLIVEREREIREFVPDEYWKITGRFTLDQANAAKLGNEWLSFMKQLDEKGNPPTLKRQNQWMAQHKGVKAELVSVGGEPFDLEQKGKADKKPTDLTPQATEIAELAGLTNVKSRVEEDQSGKGPARYRRSIEGKVDSSVPWSVESIETKRTTSRPSAPFITSTLQQAASTRLGFGAKRTMSIAQRLYEGVELKGEGAVGLITYMRTDSTNLTQSAVDRVREHIGSVYGPKYLPAKANRYSSSNKAAQEAHEAIRPTSLDYEPDRIKNALKPEEYKLYKLIWDRFVACQMTPAEWDSTAVMITGGRDPKRKLTFRATGRVLAFDGFYRVLGVPTASDEQTLPALEKGRGLHAFAMETEQKFTSAPARYTEASLIKTLESEGIGRPSTYASIIDVIQKRNYVEKMDRSFYSTDLGEVVTDKLIEAFPEIMELGYTRDMESRLDKIEDDHTDWVTVLHQFYDPFKDKLERAHDELVHAKAETIPAPEEYRCEKCGASLVYRFGKSGRFLSCSQYPKCDYACPVDREGAPKPIETADVSCHLCGSPMIKRSGRFGPFLGCSNYPQCEGILKLDKAGNPVPPSPPPITTDLPCPKCSAPLNLRNGARGPWLSCSTFPKCRGRGKWSELTKEQQEHWVNVLEEHEKKHPTPIIRDTKGNPLTDEKGKPIAKKEGSDGALEEAEEPAYSEVA